METVNSLRNRLSVSMISKITKIQRSYIYYNRKSTAKQRKSRISDNTINRILEISRERVTYGYRRVWAVARNEGTKINMKTVRKVIKSRNLQLPYAKHKNRAKKRNLTKPSDINQLWETDIHYVSTHNEMYYLMAVKDCFSKIWLSYNFSRTCTAKDCVKPIEEAYAIRYSNSNLSNLVLRTDNGPQYIAKSFKDTVRLLNNSLKTDYIWQNDLESYEDAKELMEYAFNDYNNYRPHSSIGYLTPVEFEKQWNSSEEFRNRFLEGRRKKEEMKLENMKIHIRRLNENVSILH
jgi:putative transposase